MGFLISGLSSSYLQSMLGTALQNATAGSKTTRNASATSPASVPQASEVNQPSPFAELLDTLQGLQQSNPAKYSQVTTQIATNLTSAADAAQSSGETTAATALSQLASDFSSASQTNQLPSIQDLAKSVHLYGHHSQHSSSVSGGDSNGSANQSLSQVLSAFQSGAPQNDSLNPMSIILNTLSGAGIGGSIG
jgi:hypothetical protein